MKRKRSMASRPTKKQRLQTLALVNQLQDAEEDERERLRVLDAKKAVELAYEDGLGGIRREFRSLRPEHVLPERRLTLEQKLEFEDTLKTDRLAEIEAAATARAAARAETRAHRTSAQELDEQIEECLDMASQEFSSASWQMIGKFRCAATRLANSELSADQQSRYAAVLVEMAEKGWRVRQRKANIKVPRTQQHDAAAAPAQRAADAAA